jgi:hypothetical protein
MPIEGIEKDLGKESVEPLPERGDKKIAIDGTVLECTGIHNGANEQKFVKCIWRTGLGEKRDSLKTLEEWNGLPNESEGK